MISVLFSGNFTKKPFAGSNDIATRLDGGERCAHKSLFGRQA